jgi:hypothetical protein
MSKQFVRKNWPLMSAGKANNLIYSVEVINDGFNKTMWDRKNTSIFLDHRPNEAGTWQGEVKNLHMDGEDLRGDIYISDLNSINKLEAGAKFGISPELRGREEDGEMKEMEFLNFSLVFEPAVKTTYLNKEGNYINTRYINQRFFLSAQPEKEILIEQVIDPALARFCFVDSEGNLCRTYPQNGGILNMDEKKEEAKKEEKDEVKKEVKEVKSGNSEELSEIKELLTKVLADNEAIKEELKKKDKYPEEKKEEMKKKKKEYPEPEEELEDEDKEKKKKEKYPKAEDARQMLSEEISDEILEALKEFNSDYTDFVKAYIKEHKDEGNVASLMKKAAKEWKEKTKEKEQEESKKALQENRQTVPQAGETPEKIQIKLGEMDAELAEFLVNQQTSMSSKVN